jgi:UDP-3-O-[3-hydroxymyristoyl] glucosamine N-acyltransferase
MSSKEFTILGKSNCSVAMILENLLLLYGKDFSITILKNMEDTTDSEYVIPNISISEIFVTEPTNQIDTTKNNFIIGAFRTNSKLAIHKFFKKLNIDDQNYCTIISPEAYIASTCNIGNGCIINHKCVVDSFTKLDNFVTINRSSSIGHHTTIGEFTTINPNSHIAGNCKIGKIIIMHNWLRRTI